MTAAGMLSYLIFNYGAGGPRIEESTKYLMKLIPPKGATQTSYFDKVSGYNGKPTTYPYYWCYYATTALKVKGGSDWIKWRPAMNEFLCSIQKQDGSWEGGHGGNSVGTAFALLSMLAADKNFPGGGSGTTVRSSIPSEFELPNP